MKRKALNKTLKEMLFIFIGGCVFIFFSTKFCGHYFGIQPGAAPYKCEPITYNEAIKDYPFMLFVSLGCSIFYFFPGYEYNLNKLKKEEKLKKMREQEEEKKEQEEIKEE